MPPPACGGGGGNFWALAQAARTGLDEAEDLTPVAGREQAVDTGRVARDAHDVSSPAVPTLDLSLDDLAVPVDGAADDALLGEERQVELAQQLLSLRRQHRRRGVLGLLLARRGRSLVVLPEESRHIGRNLLRLFDLVDHARHDLDGGNDRRHRRNGGLREPCLELRDVSRSSGGQLGLRLAAEDAERTRSLVGVGGHFWPPSKRAFSQIPVLAY